MEFLAILLVILLVFVIDIAAGIASLATVYCWLCAIVLWGTVIIGLVLTVRAIFVQDSGGPSVPECIFGLLACLAVEAFVIVCFSLFVEFAIAITNLIDANSAQQISLRDLIFPWLR